MPKIDREWVEAYFEHGVDVQNRRVFISDISEDSVIATIKGLYLMETMNNSQPCEMFISSYGGSMHEALALYDIMQTMRCPIHTFAFGKCMSAAPLLLAAGDKGHRWVAPNVSLMTHDWGAEIEGTGANIKATVGHYDDIGEKWNRLLASHSTEKYAHWSRLSRKPADHYFKADDAIKWGLADQIWVEKSHDA